MFDLNRLYVDQAYREERIEADLQRRRQLQSADATTETGPRIAQTARTTRRAERVVRATGR